MRRQRPTPAYASGIGLRFKATVIKRCSATELSCFCFSFSSPFHCLFPHPRASAQPQRSRRNRSRLFHTHCMRALQPSLCARSSPFFFSLFLLMNKNLILDLRSTRAPSLPPHRQPAVLCHPQGQLRPDEMGLSHSRCAGSFFNYLNSVSTQTPQRPSSHVALPAGGAWCTSLEDCYKRSKTRLGSSDRQYGGPALLFRHAASDAAAGLTFFSLRLPFNPHSRLQRNH